MTLAFALAAVGLAPVAQAAPAFQVPFTCGETWVTSTFTTHHPLNAVDWNYYPQELEIGKPVRASLAGTVTQSYYSTSTGYGNAVEIDHGGGWRTFYAHLKVRSVAKGDRVATGQKIGVIGNTSATQSLPVHLHYEQRYNGSVVRAAINGSALLYYGHQSLTSRNACGTTTTATGTIRTSGTALTVRSGPGSTYAAVGTIANGTKVTIYCQALGTSVTGTFGTSRLWDKIGTGRYVSDAYVYTGSDSRVAPDC